MRYPKITHKQQRYAYNLMNTETTKQEAMLQAGYSDSMSKKPSVVEQSDGFKLAMAGIFAKAGNVGMTILNELQTRDVSKETTKDLVNFFDVMTRAMERIAPKETKATNDDLGSVFANVINVTPDVVKPLNDKVISDVAIDSTQDM